MTNETTSKSEDWIDLRSDTLTRPTDAMRRAMAQADVGDDVFGEDPNVNALEEEIAHLLGKEAALFVPSGTMSNQVAIRVHCRSGDELICERYAHIYVYEAGGPAVLSGVSCVTVVGKRGIIDPKDVIGLIRPSDIHQPRTRLLCLENTHNRGGGSIYPLETIDRLTAWGHEQGLANHLDGARLMNAQVATGIAAERWVRGFDSVSICFSKGLGAPVGSALAGRRAFIQEARRARKLFGGGMRQAGVIAAGARHALKHHVQRLKEDHDHAQRLARACQEAAGLSIDPASVETNILWISVSAPWTSASQVVDALRAKGILALALGPMLLRFVTHLNVTPAQIGRAEQALRELTP